MFHFFILYCGRTFTDRLDPGRSTRQSILRTPQAEQVVEREVLRLGPLSPARGQVEPSRLLRYECQHSPAVHRGTLPVWDSPWASHRSILRAESGCTGATKAAAAEYEKRARAGCAQYSGCNGTRSAGSPEEVARCGVPLLSGPLLTSLSVSRSAKRQRALLRAFRDGARCARVVASRW